MAEKKMNKFVKWSLVVGALAWLVAGVTGFFGSRFFVVDVLPTMWANFVYTAVGFTALYVLYDEFM